MSSGMPGIETVPSPPALDTAAASRDVRNGPSPSWTIGWRTPTRRVQRLVIGAAASSTRMELPSHSGGQLIYTDSATSKHGKSNNDLGDETYVMSRSRRFALAGAKCP